MRQAFAHFFIFLSIEKKMLEAYTSAEFIEASASLHYAACHIICVPPAVLMSRLLILHKKLFVPHIFYYSLPPTIILLACFIGTSCALQLF
jgi:hypothetical protein